jgi:hypothetical protein
VNEWEVVTSPRTIALRHAWDWAVEAEGEFYNTGSPAAESAAAISQAWSAIAEALK